MLSVKISDPLEVAAVISGPDRLKTTRLFPWLWDTFFLWSKSIRSHYLPLIALPGN